jgi:hypothetical protein
MFEKSCLNTTLSITTFHSINQVSELIFLKQDMVKIPPCVQATRNCNVWNTGVTLHTFFILALKKGKWSD